MTTEQPASTSSHRDVDPSPRTPRWRKFRFKVYMKVLFGDAVYVVGNSEPLGYWSVEHGLRLKWSPGDWWTGSTYLEVGSTIEFKYVQSNYKRRCIDHCIWEEGPNRRMVIEPESADWSIFQEWTSKSKFAGDYEENEINFLNSHQEDQCDEPSSAAVKTNSNGHHHHKKKHRKESGSPESRFFNKVKVMSFNITGKDGENWEVRKGLITDIISRQKVDIICIQGANPHLLDHLRSFLSERYLYHGRFIGSEEGVGPVVGIFYRFDHLQFVAQGSCWLSDKPDVPGSATFGNKRPMALVWLKVLNPKTNTLLIVLNTLFDPDAKHARIKAVYELQSKVKILTKEHKDFGLMLVGNLECSPSSEEISLLTKNELFHDMAIKHFLGETQVTYTVHNWRGLKAVQDKETDPKLPDPVRTDYVFHNSKLQALRFRIIIDSIEGKIYPSDHFPVAAEFYF